MKLYHYTAGCYAERILRGGFADSVVPQVINAYRRGVWLGGVWFADLPAPDAVPRDIHDGVMLTIEAPREWRERFHVPFAEGALTFGGWKQFCVPAELANQRPLRQTVTPVVAARYVERRRREVLALLEPVVDAGRAAA